MQVVFAILEGSHVPVCQFFSPLPGIDRTLSLHHPATWYYHTSPLMLTDNAKPCFCSMTMLCGTRCYQPKLTVRTAPSQLYKMRTVHEDLQWSQWSNSVLCPTLPARMSHICTLLPTKGNRPLAKENRAINGFCYNIMLR